MRLLVLGPTGRTGGHVLDLALLRGHDVVAFARSPEKLAARPGLTTVAGDPRTGKGLGAALEGCDAVVSTLGAPPREALRPSVLMTQFGAAIVSAMKSARVPRLAVLSAAVLFPGRGITYCFFKWLLSHHARDLTGMERWVSESGLAWTIARPPRLVHADDTRFRATSGALPEGGSTVSFRAVAAFLLESIERHTFVREIVGVAR